MIFNKKIELEYKFEDEVIICRDIYKVSVSNSENGKNYIYNQSQKYWVINFKKGEFNFLKKKTKFRKSS